MRYILKHIMITMAFALMLSCGQDVPLSEYEPKSIEEKALKKVFNDFQSGVNSRNSQKVSDLLHRDASLMIGRERKIYSREEYIKILPKRLSENPPIAFGLPKMKVTGKQADVKIYLSRGGSKVLITYHMRMDGDRWYIFGWEY